MFYLIFYYADEINGKAKKKLYSKIENAIIVWSINQNQTAGALTREIMELIEEHKD
jgi:hypothetical protein